MITEHIPYIYKAKVLEVYDGDTFTLLVDLGLLTFTEIRVRLFGVDTPELRGEEREQGLIVRDYVRDLMLGKEVTIKTYKDKKGKYGRWIAEIKLPPEDFDSPNATFRDLASNLLAKGYARAVSY